MDLLSNNKDDTCFWTFDENYPFDIFFRVIDIGDSESFRNAHRLSVGLSNIGNFKKPNDLIKEIFNQALEYNDPVRGKPNNYCILKPSNDPFEMKAVQEKVNPPLLPEDFPITPDFFKSSQGKVFTVLPKSVFKNGKKLSSISGSSASGTSSSVASASSSSASSFSAPSSDASSSRNPSASSSSASSSSSSSDTSTLKNHSLWSCSFHFFRWVFHCEIFQRGQSASTEKNSEATVAEDRKEKEVEIVGDKKEKEIEIVGVKKEKEIETVAATTTGQKGKKSKKNKKKGKEKII